MAFLLEDMYLLLVFNNLQYVLLVFNNLLPDIPAPHLQALLGRDCSL